eukprot:708479_1
MSKAYQDALIHHIKSIECIGDINIMSLLNMIPFSEIQIFLQHQIPELNDNCIQKAYFDTLSINDTLPSDIIRHVLSFNTFPHNTAINATNKQWNTCSAQIKAMQNKERKQVVDNYHIDYNEEVKNVWIVDPNRSQLTNDEIAANAKGLIANVQTAIELCESGDKLLIHNGIYEVSQIHIDKSIQIVGVGDNVVLNNVADVDHTLSFQNNSISYIENVAFSVSDLSGTGRTLDNGHIDIRSNAAVTVNECKFENGIVGINCADGACLDVKSCEFIKCNFGIYAEKDAANVNVIGCQFEECGCQKPDDDFQFGYSVAAHNCYGKDTLHLRCIGNVFRNNLSLAFVKLRIRTPNPNLSLDDWSTYSLRYNILDGDKGILIDGEVVDANTMYTKHY